MLRLVGLEAFVEVGGQICRKPLARSGFGFLVHLVTACFQSRTYDHHVERNGSLSNGYSIACWWWCLPLIETVHSVSIPKREVALNFAWPANEHLSTTTESCHRCRQQRNGTYLLPVRALVKVVERLCGTEDQTNNKVTVRHSVHAHSQLLTSNLGTQHLPSTLKRGQG